MHNAACASFPLREPTASANEKGKPGLPFIDVIGIVTYCTTTFSGMLCTTFTVVFGCDLA